MFTGIITDLGEIMAISSLAGKGLVMTIATNYRSEDIKLGASIAHNGVCLTVTKINSVSDSSTTFSTISPYGGKTYCCSYMVDISPETIARTTIGCWNVGNKINLEQALKAGDELGGHFVTGHVDGVSKLLNIASEGEFTNMEFSLPPALKNYIAPKGSITINGVSLTVNSVAAESFCITIIPHTAKITNLSLLRAGDNVNLEVDIIARYVVNMASTTTNAHR